MVHNPHGRYAEELYQKQRLFDVLRTGVLSRCPNERDQQNLLPTSTWTATRGMTNIAALQALKRREQIQAPKHMSTSSRRRRRTAFFHAEEHMSNSEFSDEEDDEFSDADESTSIFTSSSDSISSSSDE